MAARLGALFTSPETSVPGSWYSGLTLPAFAAAGLGLRRRMDDALCVDGGRGMARLAGLRSAVSSRARDVGLWRAACTQRAVAVRVFGLKAPWAAIPVIAALFVAVLWTARIFWVRDQIAGLLLVPYVLWLAFASYLNIAIAASN